MAAKIAHSGHCPQLFIGPTCRAVVSESLSSIPCAICGKPVDVRTSKTDEDDKAVHEECLVEKLKHPKPPATPSN